MLWLGETRYSIDRPRYIVYTDDRSLTMPPYKLARSIRVANLARVATSLGEQSVHRARKPWSRVNCVDRFPSFRQACFPKPNISKGYFLWQKSSQDYVCDQRTMAVLSCHASFFPLSERISSLIDCHQTFHPLPSWTTFSTCNSTFIFLRLSLDYYIETV